jgi:transglutaminase-like putative cysteine protease
VIALSKALRWIVTQIASRFGVRKPLLMLLLLAVVGSVALGLAAHVRDLNVGLASIIAAVSVFLGWVLAARAERGWSAVLLMMVSGLLLILVATGRLADELLAVFAPTYSLARDSIHLIWQLLWEQGKPPSALPAFVGSWDGFVVALAALTDGAGVVFDRVFGWVATLLRGGQSPDPVAAAFVWALALWIVVTWAIWLLVRRDRVLLGVAPAAALLVTTLFSVDGDPQSVLVLLGAVLLMLGLVAYDSRVRRMEATDLDIAYGVSTDVAVASILLTVALVAAAAAAPSISPQDIYDFIQDALARRAGAAEGGDSAGQSDSGDTGKPESGPLITLDEMRYGGLPRNHLLTTPPDELSKLVVMVISTGELPPMPEFGVEGVEVPRHYWRGVTYDNYSLRGWLTSGTWTADYAADDVLGPPPSETQRVLRQEVTFVSNLGGILHADGALVTVDKDYSVAWRAVEDPFGATVDADSYVAHSLVVQPTAAELRIAGTDYPDWVVARYLDLPDAVTARTVALAQDLTATEPTPYDRAAAIEIYLRTSFTYTLDVGLPPAGRDTVDYFLFDLKEGYCDYYASSMVVLARAAGLPARLAIGYAPGYYDLEEARYIVTEADAHAWPEVYFPGYGWVRFEPTAGQPAIDRAEKDEEAFVWPEFPDSEEAPPPLWAQLVDRWWMVLLGGGLGGPVVSAVLWLAVDNWRLRRMEPAAAVTTAYDRLRRFGQRLGARVPTGATPYEYGDALADMLKGLAKGRRWQETQAAASKEIERLTDAYVRVSYSAGEPDRIDRATAVMAWQALRWSLWLARLHRGRVLQRRNKHG